MKAFAPGHVSGLFAVHDEATDVLRRGSRGAGWSVDLGATAVVTDGKETNLRINGRQAVANVTRLALHHLAPEAKLDVDLRLDLPVGQGFGMSAAGTLATCLAAAGHLGLDPDDALRASHAAEVESGTGLGDVAAAWHGAAEIRARPGIPGQVVRVDPPGDAKFLYVVAGAAIPTPSVIRDPAWKARTRELGDAAVERILAVGRSGAWRAILEESMRFSQELGLMPASLRALGESLPEDVLWGQCMLGSTLWATGPREGILEAERRLARAGPVLHAGVDSGGARLVR